ncbi:choline transporter-like 1 isoform X1 [Bacillus rossius redtenbacheri]
MSCCDGDEGGEAQRPASSPRPRSCTDVVWLCFFIAFLFLMIVIAAFAIVYGNPLRLINGYDSFGNTCGTNYNEKREGDNLSGVNTIDKPYLLFMDVGHVSAAMKICVKKCPDRNLDTLSDIRKFYQETGSKLCRYDFDMKEFDNRSLNDKEKLMAFSGKFGPCPSLPVYKSAGVLNRCVPRLVSHVTGQVFHGARSLLEGWGAVEQILGDLYATWKEITCLMVAAFVLSLAMIAVIHWLASCVAWIFMLAVSVAAVAGTGFLWWTYADLKRSAHSTPDSLLSESVYNETAFLTYSIIATVITVVILLLVAAVRKSVGFMAQLFQESAECLADMPALFLQPLLTFLALVAFFSLWVYVIVCLATSSYPGTESYFPFSGSGPSPTAAPVSSRSALRQEGTDSPLLTNISLSKMKSFTWLRFVEPAWVPYMWWVYLVGLIWVSEFFLSCQQMVIAGAVAQWYFSQGKNESCSVLSSMGQMFSFHLGSVVKGSFLITLFKLPRLVLTYIDFKLRQAKEAGSTCALHLLRCCVCCLYCFEQFIKFMNHNAYTVVAMEGTSFCTSARIAWNALVSNALNLATVNSIGDFILFLGKCIVTAVTGSIGLLIMKHNPHLHFYAIPTLVVCIFAFFIAHSVISLYEVVIDTMFLCKCEAKRLYGDDWQSRRHSKGAMELTSPINV